MITCYLEGKEVLECSIARESFGSRRSLLIAEACTGGFVVQGGILQRGRL